MTDRHAVALVAVLAAVTALLRFAPFLLFSRGDAPPVIRRLGMLLPGATMAMLVVYCLRNVSLSAAPHGLPELIAGALTVGLHLWRRNTLLSIIAGTVCYMVLVQNVFL